MTTQEREDRDARVARNVAAVSRINGLFKRRYGDYAEDESAPTLFAANDQSDGGSYNFPIKLQFECDHSAKCPTCEWVSEMYVNSTHAWVLGERPDDGVRTCGACGCHWRATEKCSHEKQKT